MTEKNREKYMMEIQGKTVPEAKKYMQDLMKKYFPSNEIKYIV